MPTECNAETFELGNIASRLAVVCFDGERSCRMPAWCCWVRLIGRFG
jgi:hypothetical protein